MLPHSKEEVIWAYLQDLFMGARRAGAREGSGWSVRPRLPAPTAAGMLGAHWGPVHPAWGDPAGPMTWSGQEGTAVRAATKTTRGTALAMCHISKKLLATQPDHILPSPAPAESTPGSQHSSPFSPEAGSESLSGLSRAASSKSTGCTRHRQTSGQRPFVLFQSALPSCLPASSLSSAFT